MLTLANPLILAALPLPIIIWWFTPEAKVPAHTALHVPFYAAITRIMSTENYRMARLLSLFIPFLVWCLLIIALAGPRWVGPPQTLEREGYNLMLALDLSGSMEIQDMLVQGRPVSRLSVVKNAATQFVRQRSGDKIGLILFGTRAYLQTPLTYDRDNILQRLTDASVRLAGETTSIGDAVGLAVKKLKDVPTQGRVIILLTDGANNSGVLDPLKAAELAKDEGIKIYTIGLGAERDPRLLNNGFLMQAAMADLDEETLKKIADTTGGRYFRATDLDSLQAIYGMINQLERIKQKHHALRPQIEYYPWFTAFALLLFSGWLAWSWLHARSLLFSSKGQGEKYEF
ncbi:MAG: hypothetical protein BGO90_11950 [Legionella sp. 40-6]|nr:VWA domain-containing protein [Legionella sp.]OJY01672.1 MAG: hypothetical protein BGO90_11950 [Legionella sp. 40-6]